jgi:hypothetical protein
MERVRNTKKMHFENFFVVTMSLKCLPPVSDLNPKIVKLKRREGGVYYVSAKIAMCYNIHIQVISSEVTKL